MRKIFIFLLVIATWMPLCGQATNPQMTFGNAVSSVSPTLWLNYNDATSAFKDSASGLSMSNSVTTTVTSTVAINAVTTCVVSGTTLTCTVGASAGGGDAIVVFLGAYAGNSITVSNVVDSGGATAVLLGGSSTTGFTYYFANVAGGSHTITATIAGTTGSSQMWTYDVSGASHVSPVDAYVTKAQTAVTAITSGAVTTTSAGDMLVAATHTSTNGETFTVGSPSFTLKPNSFSYATAGYYLAGAAGSYTFNLTASSSTNPFTTVVAIKPQVTTTTYTSGTVTTQQPGFDNTNPSQLSAEYPYSGFSVAPNNSLGAIEWNLPWSMLVHLDRLNWNRTGSLVLASKGDLGTCAGMIAGCGIGGGSWWQVFIHMNGLGSQLCFERNGIGSNGLQAQQAVCSGQLSNLYEGIPNGMNYDIVIEDSGTGTPSALTMYMNGSAIGASYTGASFSNTYAQGFGAVTLAVSGGTGYANTTAFTSTGGGANCLVTGNMTSVSGVPTTITSPTGQTNAGCTSNPTIVLTSPTGTGAVITATSGTFSMNSTTASLMAPGYLSNGTVYGVAGSTTSQAPTYMDEFAIFPSDLTFGQVTNIFYTTKFYQAFLYPYVQSSPPLVILGGYGCGPDFSGNQTIAMTLGAARAGIIKLIGMTDDDGAPTSLQSIALWRQLLDSAGFADVPVGIQPGSPTTNVGGCPSANLNAYNASTSNVAANYPTSATLYRTLYAKYPTQPIYALVTQVATGYAAFVLSPADSISPLTGLQLQAQNAANGAWMNLYQGNLGIVSGYSTIYNNNGALPIYIPGGAPAPGGPGIEASRTANDPMYLAAVANSGDTIIGYTNPNLAMVISPYFWGGVTVSYSGGTGYANSTPFTSTGGGTYCKVTGIMTASGGVPNGIETYWGTSFPSTTTYNGLGYGCTSAPTIVLTNPTGTGVTLTAATTYPLTCYGNSGCTNQYVVYPNYNAAPAAAAGQAPIFSWFENSLMDPPVNGRPSAY